MTAVVVLDAAVTGHGRHPANDSPYGLTACVWGRDSAHAEHVARRIEAGVVTVSDAQVNSFATELPMGAGRRPASATATD